MYISHSKVELYSTCPYKYYLMSVEKWSTDKTYSALLFGSAVDRALNYVLTRTKHHHIPNLNIAQLLFDKSLSSWNGQNELIYFKNEAPNSLEFEEADHNTKQDLVFENLMNIGYNIIETYIKDILPQLGTILSVQTKRFIPNQSGDTLVLITDFRARLPDGREVTFDNKTSSDIKKYYGPSSVKKSQQLAIYTEYEPTKLAGYIALSKKIDHYTTEDKDAPPPYVIRIDEIVEEQTEQAFQKVDTALLAIKSKEFPKNEKSCWSFGRKCEMWDLCKKGKTDGLIKR